MRCVSRWRSSERSFWLQEGDSPPGQPAVGLELRLAGAPRADAAAEALEVLPHASHARKVVLELRELDLELALRRSRVLGEDVEDQLRPIDDAQLERVLEAPLLARIEVVVHDEGLAPGSPPPRPSAPRSGPCRGTCGGRERSRRCTISPTGSTPAVRISSRTSPSSSSASISGASAATRKARSGSAPGAGSGWCWLTSRHYARLRGRSRARQPCRMRDAVEMRPPAHRLFAMAPTRRSTQAGRAYARPRRRAVGEPGRGTRRRAGRRLRCPAERSASGTPTARASTTRPSGRPGSRSSCSPATWTRFRPRTTCPAGSRTAGWSASARPT